MSASYFDLLKYAATGQASPDMTYYDRMRASTLMGGVVQTLTGQPPLSFKADGTPLISWSMKGNGSQTGTPTPDNPIIPEFVGVRTKNLLAANGTVTINNVSVTIASGHFLIVGTTNSEISSTNTAWKALDFTLPAGTYRFKTDALIGVGFYIKNYETSAQLASRDTSFTLEAETHCYIAFYIYRNNSGEERDIMLNTGSVALPYEPFGWAEKITCAGQTVPVYLGQTQTVRRVRKLVLTGEETFGYVNSCFTYTFDGKPASVQPTKAVIFSNAYEGIEPKYRDQLRNYQCCITRNYNQLAIRDDNYTEIADYQSYLAQQYAAGTPVTIWYVLATEQTGIVNEPLAKIGTYSDELLSTDAAVTIPTARGSNTLTVDTELQPSEMSITYRG